MSLRFEVEWLDAPGVADLVLAPTWGRLEIRLADQLIATSAIHASGHRTGVYGAMFPFARWLVSNYWSLLYEVPLSEHTLSARRAPASGLHLAWTRRHNVLCAREGFSLPDLTFASDGDAILVAVFPDQGSDKRTNRPVSFIADGRVRLRRDEVVNGIAGFVDAVLERLRGVEHDDATQLADDWRAVLASRREEPWLCEWAARLGQDPYDPRELTDSLVELLEGRVARLASPLRGDVLDTRWGSSLVSAVEWIEAQLGSRSGFATSVQPGDPFQPAHLLAYARAREVRRALRLGPGDNVPFEVGKATGFGLVNEAIAPRIPAQIDGALLAEADGSPVLLGPEVGHDRRVFRWARAFYTWHFGYAADSPRLLTRSHARQQREGRAFAAELLVPAAELATRIDAAEVGDDELDSLAREFGVAPQLIRHQIDNHRLAALRDL